jgi:acetoin utilization deacetylase AcuC-like enzyme
MEKLAVVANAVEQRGLAELVDPGVIEIELLRELHDPDLVDDFLVGRKPLATLQGFAWDKALRDGVLSIQAGQLCAASLAFFDGISANIAQGFHHAGYDYGSGFCTFNGLALVAQQYPDRRVFVLDCDQHGGNGTAEMTERLPNLFNFTIYGLRFGCQDFPRSIGRKIPRKMGEGSFEKYKEALQEGFEKIREWRTELIIYQAGVDCHQFDPFGSEWFGTDALFERDRMVFEFARQHNIPVMFVLAGGYQEMSKLVELHANTFVAATQVYGSK